MILTEKRCTKCSVAKPVTAFASNGRVSHCKDCVNTWARETAAKRKAGLIETTSRTEKRCSSCRITKPIDDFGVTWLLSDGRSSQCKLCIANRDMLRMYGVSLDQFQTMLEKQKFQCLICGVNHKTKPLCIDHNHETGLVRGLLCKECNSAIAFFGEDKENLWAAAKYLAKHNSES